MLSRLKRYLPTHVTDERADREEPSGRPSLPAVGDLDRRRFLRGAGAAALALGGAKAADNLLLGYGRVSGENLTEQDPRAVAAEGLLAGERETRVGPHRLAYDDGTLTVAGPGVDHPSVDLGPDAPARAAAVDARLEGATRPGVVERTVRDLAAIREGRVAFRFESYEAFFERLEGASDTVRPATAGLLRGGSRGVDPALVERFTGVPPTDPRATLDALVGAFDETTHYDLPRYAAGTVYYNLLDESVDVREPFRSPTDFQTLLDAESVGIFCFELARRSAEALHSIPPARQRVPVAGALTWDPRHEHTYTAVASAVREADELVVPVTFVDYTPTTLYADFGVDGLGDGPNAYNTFHRARRIRWNH